MPNVALTVRLWADRTLSPAALSAQFVRKARVLRDDLVDSGKAPRHWSTVVDGKVAATEEGARRVIEYRFARMGEAVRFVLAECIRRSPSASGAYRDSWFVAVDGKVWTGNFDDLGPDQMAIVCNWRPYARKIDVGAMKLSVPSGIVEAARQAAQRKFSPALLIERGFVSLPGGLFPNTPYVLKGHQHLKKAIANRRSSAHRAGRVAYLPRKDTAAGAVLTYPCVEISVWRGWT